jgi:Mechanosensitive ion channel, conserved TM helix
MDSIATIWNNIVASIQLYAPSILAAIVLIVVAWLVATLLRAVVVRVLTALKFDERFGRSVGDPNTVSPLSKTIGNVVFWLTILLFLPGILGALNLPGILLPVQNMVNTALEFLPNILAAIGIFVVGWFVASIVKRVLVSIFDAVGVDRLATRFGISQALGSQRLSNVLATIVYFIILVPVFIAALNALHLDAITAPASAMLNNILLAIPNIFAAFLLLAIAYVAAQIISGLVTSVLTAVGFNRLFAALGLSRAQAAVDRASTEGMTYMPPAAGTSNAAAATRAAASKTPSELVGYLITVTVMLFAAVEALRLLGFVALADIVLGFLALLGQIIIGLIILAIGLWLSNIAATVIEESGSRWANILAPAERVAILVLAGAMALRQMGLAPEIVNLAFGLLLGAIAVAVALAFGLGGREVAAQLLSDWRKDAERQAEPKMVAPGDGSRRGSSASRPTAAE